MVVLCRLGIIDCTPLWEISRPKDTGCITAPIETFQTHAGVMFHLNHLIRLYHAPFTFSDARNVAGYAGVSGIHVCPVA